MIFKIWFSKVKIDNLKKILLINYFKTEENIFKLTYEELRAFSNLQISLKMKKYVLTTFDIEEILSLNNRRNLEKTEKYIIKNKIKIISIYDEFYPKILEKISDPPTYLYLVGNINILNEDIVSVIGSRNASEYGKKVAKDIAEELSNNNIIVSSGMAKGIDSYSHYGALNGKCKKTIAVLANGLYEPNIYPKENLNLYKKIIEFGGSIITEQPIEAVAKKENFPKRNRIISGISKKIIVVEAALNSGTFITVDFALEQGKDVYAVPGMIYSDVSKGCNKLIQEGANIFTNCSDLYMKNML